jgi:hypothetical protein
VLGIDCGGGLLGVGDDPTVGVVLVGSGTGLVTVIGATGVPRSSSQAIVSPNAANGIPTNSAANNASRLVKKRFPAPSSSTASGSPGSASGLDSCAVTSSASGFRACVGAVSRRTGAL